MHHRCPKPLGLQEIAQFLGVKPNTAVRWRYRRLLPDPDGWISGTVPYWLDVTIERWAQATGRWKGTDADGRARLAAVEEARRAEHEAIAAASKAEQLRIRRSALEAQIAAAEAAEHAALEAARAATADVTLAE